MRFRPLLPLLLLATPVSAHTGHLGALGGHDHWTLGVGIGVIVGAAVIAWVKGKKETQEPEEDAAEEESETA
ncbi:MAG: DUF6732 family protein [Jannaschia sp.]